MNKKVLILGIDGGTWRVLKPAMDQGCMPFVKSLADAGASGTLESTIPAITPAAWGGFQTGKSPGKTGVFDFAYWDKKEKESHYVSSLDLGETLWSILSRHNKRVAVINVPMTYPPQALNGYLVSGLLTPSLESNFTWPPEFKQQIMEEFPDYHIFDLKKIAKYRSEEEEMSAFIRHLVSVIQVRTRLALWMLQKEVFDLFMVHFQATDVLQHIYWHFLDDSHPLFDQSKQTEIFKEFYQELDRCINAIYDRFCEKNGQPLTVILSDHGFQAHYKRFNLGNWLESEGYLKKCRNSSPQKTPILKKITQFLRVGKILKYVLPQKTIQVVDKKYISRNQLFDWKESRAYSVGRSNEGFIYLLPEANNKQAGLPEELRNKLYQIADPETGQPVVKKVWLKAELYHGPQIERLPDIVIEPQEGYSFTGYYQVEEGLFHLVTHREDIHIGKHHPDGVIVTSGKEVEQRAGFTAKIIDVAPMLLYYLGVPIPESMDGRILTDLFKKTYKDENPIIKEDQQSDHGQASQTPVYTPKDNDDIEQRLRDLGYL